uniref:Uncharacterized protein n=1 Tax=Triticum urartu TaxID=4572 RepID=A0A8R7PRA8_TRIUA
MQTSTSTEELMRSVLNLPRAALLPGLRLTSCAGAVRSAGRGVVAIPLRVPGHRRLRRRS